MSYSRHAERQRYSGDDYSRSSRSSHSSKRREDKVKRRGETDRDRDRRNEKRRSAEGISRKKYAPKEDSRHSKLSRSRSKADRTYNTDTEESDESSESPCRDLKRRLSSDHDDDKHQSDGNDGEATAKKTSSYSLLTIDSRDKGSLKDIIPRKNKDGELTPKLKSSKHSPKTKSSENLSRGPTLPPQKEETRSIGPLLPLHVQQKGSPDNSKDNLKSSGPVLPPHLQRKDSPDSGEDDPIIVGPVLPPRLQRKDSPDSEDESSSVGPVLPVHLQRRVSQDCEKGYTSTGPVSPPHLQKSDSDNSESKSIGPVLPPHLRRKSTSDSEDESKSIGPALPLKESSKPDDDYFFGPALPPSLKQSSSRTLGPSLPPGLELPEANDSEDSNDEVIGPMLPEQLIKSNKNYLVHSQLERRAAEVKKRMEEKDVGPEVTQREEWMLELPPEGTIDLGLKPRTFRVKGAPEKGADRSMWTDTPADKLRKEEQAIRDAQNEGTSTRAEIPPEISQRDREMEKVAKKHSKKRGKDSLLDLHQKELNKKKKKDKEDGKKEERRPFSREVDLKTNVFDEAQKKSIFKKAQLLDSRFSRGESKYL